MQVQLLSSFEEAVGGIIVIVGAALMFYGVAVIKAFLGGRPVKSGTFGPVMAKPEDLPNMIKGLSKASIDIYNKIKDKIPNKENNNNKSLEAILEEINVLKQQKIISDNEFQILREDILRKYFEKRS